MRYSEQILKSWTEPLSQSEKQRAEHSKNMVRSAIAYNPELSNMDIEVFCQGSYANNTNVRAESDVDICVMLKSTFYYDLPKETSKFDFNFASPTISFPQFRAIVKYSLQKKFGEQCVIDGNNSLKIRENTYHVKADVVPAFQYRHYLSLSDIYDEGTLFLTKDGSEIINYPKIHLENGRAKNQDTSHRYKKLVRIMKHIKNNMEDEGLTDGNHITSFLVESLIWNVPNNIITGYESWVETVKHTLNYLLRVFYHNDHQCWKEVSDLLYLFRNRKWSDIEVRYWLHNTYKYLGF